MPLVSYQVICRRLIARDPRSRRPQASRQTGSVRRIRPSARSALFLAPSAEHDRSDHGNGLSGGARRRRPGRTLKALPPRRALPHFVQGVRFAQGGSLIGLEILDASEALEDNVQFEVVSHPILTTVRVELDLPTRSASASRGPEQNALLSTPRPCARRRTAPRGRLLRRGAPRHPIGSGRPSTLPSRCADPFSVVQV